MKKQKGITLIALIITIIVLLILAGVSINLVVGQNGVLTRAQDAVLANDLGAAKEQAELLILDLETEYYQKKYSQSAAEVANKTSREYLISQIGTSGKQTSNGKYTVKVDESGNVTVLNGEKTIAIGWLNNEVKINWGEKNAPSNGGEESTPDNSEEVPLAAGLYNANDELVCSWDDLVTDYGLDVTKAYTSSTYETDTASMYYILNNNENLSTATKLIIDDAITSIGSRAFYGCTGLTSVTIPDSVTSIGFDAFLGCKGLTSITIPNSVTSIGIRAFHGCTGLTSIKIPDGVTSIENSAFYGCTGLTSIKIPDGVTSIGDSAFSGCTGLTSITIPDSVTSIGSYAFVLCTGLTSITIPDSVTSVGNRAFNVVANVIYNGSTTGAPWGARAINGYVEGNFVYADETKTMLCAVVNVTGDVVIPNSVTSIGDSAFYGCTGLTSIAIPDGVTSIGDSAFSDCTGLTNVTIPDGVKNIESYTFNDCTGLTNVTIPDGVISIGEYAFYNCTGLTNVTIPDGVTSIGNRAFYGCTGLTSITIPDGVTQIEFRAFYNVPNVNYNGSASGSPWGAKAINGVAQ